MIFGGIILGIEFGYPYFGLSIISLILTLYLNNRRKKQIFRMYMEQLENQWGKEHEENRNFLHIKKLYKILNKKTVNKFQIDDITWRDLNMDQVFEKVDHTKSLPGMQYLYNILRNPIFNEDKLEERHKLISQIKKDKETAKKIQYPLAVLGKDEANELFAYFESGINIETKSLIFYRILSCLIYLFLILLIINRQLGFTLLLTVVIVNAMIYQREKNRIYSELEIFRYIASLLKTAEKLVEVDSKGIDIGQIRLEEILKKTKEIYKNISKLNTDSGNESDLQVIFDYINMINLRETIIFYKTINLLNENKDNIMEIYGNIGRIDAYTAIASYKSGLAYYTEPNLIDDKSKFYLQTEELYHPLLEEPVPYTFELDNIGALVTGSNASGKSTLLRTIGINTIFAQTLYFVLGKEYKANYFKLLTSIGTTDNIVEGDSYFMAEAKSLKRIIDTSTEKFPVLCILDEIFRGTNTGERISAASEVLNYMIDRNSCVIAATHDLELTTIVDNRYHNYHFQETIEENDIKFDYILRHGPATSRNAIAILKYLGYPKEIHENADANAEEYEMFN